MQQAFDIARQSIDSLFADNNYLANESAKFVFLPRKADHIAVLYPPLVLDMSVEKKENCEAEAELLVTDHTPKRGTAAFPAPPLSE